MWFVIQEKIMYLSCLDDVKVTRHFNFYQTIISESADPQSVRSNTPAQIVFKAHVNVLHPHQHPYSRVLC